MQQSQHYAVFKESMKYKAASTVMKFVLHLRRKATGIKT
jgi:hypothetical protein